MICCDAIVEASIGFRLDPTSVLDLYKVFWYFDTTLCMCMGIWGHVVMPLLRLQQASDWIPHPYWMYTKCFGTLICWVWAYGATLTVIRLCRSGVDFGVLGVDLSPCNVVM